MIATRLVPVGLDELTARAALLTRVDRKYLVPLGRLDPVVGLLAADTRILDIDGRRSHSYRSMYFDTPSLLSYRGTALRRRRRFKIRTRSYLDSGVHLLEVKTRGPRGVTVKQRVPYDGDGIELSLLDRCSAVAALPSALPVDVDLATRLRPVLLTHYRRSTLYLPATGSRVTIDTGLTWTRPDGSNGLRVTGWAIVETKTAGLPAEMDRALWAHGIRPVSVSKYGTGLALLRPDLPAHRWSRVVASLTTEPEGEEAATVSHPPGCLPAGNGIVRRSPRSPLSGHAPAAHTPGDLLYLDPGHLDPGPDGRCTPQDPATVSHPVRSHPTWRIPSGNSIVQHTPGEGRASA